MPNTGKITQIIGAVLDIKFTEGHLPAIYEAINITRKNGENLVVEVAQHLGDRDRPLYCDGTDRRTRKRHGGQSQPELRFPFRSASRHLAVSST